jgi:glucose-6-phosphate dehydrogenase assembly protein OpcA
LSQEKGRPPMQQDRCSVQPSAGECRDNARLAAAQARVLREVFRQPELADLAWSRAVGWRRAARAAQQIRRPRCRRS